MNKIKNKRLKIISIMLIAISVVVRIYSSSFSNSDMDNYNLKWYGELANNGIRNTLATNFTEYSPPYTYLLAFASLSRNFIPPLTALKLISTFFDIVGLCLVFKITKIKYPQNDIPHLAAAAYFAAPTIIINSSYWGQVDSFYTCFLLLCLYYLLMNKSRAAMIAFGVAFAIKAQAIFFAPFLMIMVLRKRISWAHLLGIPPLIYLLAIAPVVWLGRGFLDALLVYLNQAGSYKILSANAPNFYIFFDRSSYSLIMPIGLFVAAGTILWWVYLSYRAKPRFTAENIVLLALLSTAITPFLLPKMHDRYFYPANVFSIVLAAFQPELWFIPVLYQIISSLATSIFLFNMDDHYLVIAALLNALAIAMLLKVQREHQLLYKIEWKSVFPTAIYKWIFILLTPLVLVGMGLNIFATQTFYRIETKLPHSANDQTRLSYQEQVAGAQNVFRYMSNEIEASDLYTGNPANDKTLLSRADSLYLQEIKVYWTIVSGFYKFSLLTLYLLSLLGWAGNALEPIRNGIRIGAWLTVFITGMTTLFSSMLWFFKVKFPTPFPLLSEEMALPSLFPPHLFINGFIFLLSFLIFSAITIILGLRTGNNS